MEQAKVERRHLGLIDFKEAWDIQESLFQGIVDQKVLRRKDSSAATPPNYLLSCEHPHVYTIGKSGKDQHLLIDEAYLKKIGASVYRINRGGDITYHGPGQVVIYPLFDLDQFFTDIHKYLRYLEEAVIRTLAEYDLVGVRSSGETGVWLDIENRPRKICAMGVRAARWVTMHGLALNVNTDMSYFNHIVPCGIQDKAVTSMEMELGEQLSEEIVSQRVQFHIQELFGFEI
ncbi:MAG: lipoyl(octanoyl) transferase LipB [Flavobacteriales bacterium]|nr:MAG: lipoyl(octanoyl) transferase LipB [Flavobacteriales bacterium]